MPDWIDLTRPVRNGMAVFADGEVADPPVEIQPWCTVEAAGWAVQRISLGTQTGTHIDAPAHWLDDGATLDALPAAAGLAEFVVVPVTGLRAGLSAAAELGLVPVVDATATPGPLPTAELDALDLLRHQRHPLLVLAGEVLCSGPDPYAVNRRWAELGGFLVEDLDVSSFDQVGPRGRILVAWPNLAGTSGAPCRVLLERA